MYPVICHIGPFSIYSFGVMFLTALLVCSFLLSREAKAYGILAEDIYDFVFWVILSGIVGARLFFISLNFSFYVQNPMDMVMIQKGGLAWQGGLLGGFVAGIIYSRRLKKPVLFLMDLVAPYLALGQAIGRVGCFLNGCCYGRPVSWGIYFPVHDARLYPTQLYDVAGLLAIFFVLRYLGGVLKTPGKIFAVYLMSAAAERFLNEFFRGDHAQTYAGLSVFQIFSLGIFLAGLFLFFILKHPRAGAPARDPQQKA